MADALTLSPDSRAALARIGDEFLANVLRVEVSIHPQNLEAWADLGHILTRLERFEEGLAIDRQLVERMPEDATAHYNLACSLALCGRPEEALAALEAAFTLGYRDVEHLLQDADLATLRGRSGFERLIGRMRAASS